MLKIKNEKGITLVALVITIIVLIIILSITIDLGLDSVDSTNDRKLKAELQIVQQACITEYTKAKMLGYIKDDSNIPLNFVGTSIDVFTEKYRNVIWSLNSVDTTIGYKKYFLLDKDDLESLNIENSGWNYIVNYYTGEVYNETVKVTSDNKSLYIKSVENHQTVNNMDNENFVDSDVWSN